MGAKVTEPAESDVTESVIESVVASVESVVESVESVESEIDLVEYAVLRDCDDLVELISKWSPVYMEYVGWSDVDT